MLGKIAMIIGFSFWVSLNVIVIQSIIKSRKAQKFEKKGYLKQKEISIFDVDDYFCMKCKQSKLNIRLSISNNFHHIFAYLCQAYTLGFTGEKLFKENIIVTHNPVKFAGSYHNFKIEVQDLKIRYENGHNDYLSSEKANAPQMSKFSRKQIEIMDDMWNLLTYLIKNLKDSSTIFNELMSHEPVKKAIEKITRWNHEQIINTNEMEVYYLTEIMLRALDVPEDEEA